LTQSRAGLVSDPVAAVWIYDITAPVATWITVPQSPTPELQARFEFKSNESGSKFMCQVDLDESKLCSSPFDVGVGIGTHNVALWTIDPAGNTSPRITHQWVVAEKSSTLALYHLESFFNEDSGPNGLKLREADGTPKEIKGVFGSGIQFFGKNTLFNDEIDGVADFSRMDLTLEGFMNPDIDIPVETTMILMSKSTAADDSTFEVRLFRATEGELFLEFTVGLNGAGTKVLRSENLGSAILGTWTYFAVTWIKGTATIYTGQDPGSEAVMRAQATLADPDTPLTRTRSSLVLGGGATNGKDILPYRGGLDEIRISSQALDIKTVPLKPLTP